ncbi:MAG TPA: DUF924 family protein [Novosphingobium sp.]|nr:DUF924 family protein [Novosphingobium sp.]
MGAGTGGAGVRLHRMGNEKTTDGQQAGVLDFWFRNLTPQDWFQGGERLDTLIRERFGALHRAAAMGEHDDWAGTPLGRLALVIVLDQFSRNIHRDDPRAFAQDARALELALAGIAGGEDERLTFSQRHFLYMPLMHSEDPEMQRRSIERFTALRDFAEDVLAFARSHGDEIARFGRFPHRNAALGRNSTDAEAAFVRGDG